MKYSKQEDRLTLVSNLKVFKNIFWPTMIKFLDSATALKVLNKVYTRSIAKNWLFVDTSIEDLAQSENYIEPENIVLNKHPIIHKDTYSMNSGTCYNYMKFLMDANIILRIDIRDKIKNPAKYNPVKRYAINIPGILRQFSLNYQTKTAEPNMLLVEQISKLENFFVKYYKRISVGLPVVLELKLTDMHLTKANRKKRVMPKRKKPATVLTLVNKAEESV